MISKALLVSHLSAFRVRRQDAIQQFLLLWCPIFHCANSKRGIRSRMCEGVAVLKNSRGKASWVALEQICRLVV